MHADLDVVHFGTHLLHLAHTHHTVPVPEPAPEPEPEDPEGPENLEHEAARQYAEEHGIVMLEDAAFDAARRGRVEAEAEETRSLGELQADADAAAERGEFVALKLPADATVKQRVLFMKAERKRKKAAGKIARRRRKHQVKLAGQVCRCRGTWARVTID